MELSTKHFFRICLAISSPWTNCHLESTRGDNEIALITAVSFIEPHLIDKGQHTTLDKISKNVYTKNLQNYYYIVKILHYTHTHTHTHTVRQKECNKEWGRVKGEGTQVRIIWNHLWYCLQRWVFNEVLKACEDWMWQITRL